MALLFGLYALGLTGILLLLIWLRQRRQKARQPVPTLIVDGSNVLFWDGGEPSLSIVAKVVNHLAATGWKVGVIFDANVGYRIGTRYLDDADMARRLNLPADRVLVVPKGTPADAYVLRAARDMGARVVSNDRFRDWAKDWPEVTQPGFLIRGGVRDGRVWVDMGADNARAA
jgi:hypothetical protein